MQRIQPFVAWPQLSDIATRGSAAIAGQTTSPDFPTTPDALQSTTSGLYNGFVTGLASSATRPGLLGYSSYLHGGTGETEGYAVAKDGQANIVVVGQTQATDLPGAAGTQQPANAGAFDAYVAKFITTPTCPSGEDCADIGAPTLSGDQLYSGNRAKGTWSVTGSGADIWGTSDHFHFVAQDAAGDGSISARILTQDNTGQFAKAGVMYRASEDPAAPYYFVALTPYNGGTLQVQYRSAPGAVAQDLADFLVTAPLYVRVRRAGNQFAADTSSDGQTWTSLPNSTVRIDSMPLTALAGLAVDSFTTSAASTATFDKVTITSCPTAWSCQDIGSPAQAGSQIVRDDQSLESLVNFPVTGGGADVWGTSDQFHYVDTTLAGDSSVSARISAQQNTDGWAKAGVMLRASADPGAPYYFVMLTPGNGVNVQYRDGQGASAQWPVSYLADSTPVYLRADRVGTTFTAYTSHDNVNWTLVPGSQVTIGSLAGDILAGPAVTAHNAGATSAATFDFVRVDQCPDVWSCGDINAPPVPGGQYLDNGIFSLRGVGTGVGAGATQDRFHFAWQNIAGDGSLSARLSSQVDTGTQARTGLMYRASGAPGAPYVMLSMTANNGLVVQARTTAGGSSTTVATSGTAPLPAYLQIARTGNTFTAYTSSDDATWLPVANSSVSIGAMPATAELGLAADAYDANATSVATFDTVDISGTPAATSPVVGADLANLDTHTAHYTQGSNGTVHLQFYNGPIGIPDATQWQWRDPSLAAATQNTLAPANLPFTETIASNSGGLSTAGAGTTLAALTSEDGVTLSVGLTTTAPAQTPASGQVRSNAVTYAAVEPSNSTPVPTTSDLSLRSTASGLDARVVLHSAAERGPFLLTLGSAPTIQWMQNGDGTIRATQAITGVNDDGTIPYTTTQTEYIVQAPLLVDSSTAVTAPVSTGPATTTLTSPAAGTQQLALSVDPAWLNAPGRTFPVSLDLPIATAYSAANTTLFGTTNSCAPSQVAPQTEMVVGATNGCAYNGQAYYDLSALPDDTSIVSASLRLYTPAQLTATGVQVYQNAPPPPDGDPSVAPSWNTAPLVMTGTTGLAQAGSDGHWQSWDVTSLVQGWVQDNSTTAGLTLMSGGAPARFASPLGAGVDAATTAPYLDITYATARRPHPPYYVDRATNIYGVSGSFVSADSTAVSSGPIPGSTIKALSCGKRSIACGGDTRVGAVRKDLAGSLIRIGVQMSCTSTVPGPTYWNSFGKQIAHGRESANINGNDSISNILTEAFKSNVVPIINFLLPDPAGDTSQMNSQCQLLGSGVSGYQDNWKSEINNFVNTVLVPLAPLIPRSLPSGYNGPLPYKFMYFEIGNEQNIHNQIYYGGFGNYKANNYPLVFAAAAKGISAAIGGMFDPRALNYRVLTAGMIEPTAQKTGMCQNPKTSFQDPDGGGYNEDVAVQAIISATAQGVSAANLGFAVHPYNYSTYFRTDPHPRTTYWTNYYHMYPAVVLGANGPYADYNTYPGVCRDLLFMTRLWTSDKRIRNQHLPLIFTEDNWSDFPQLLTQGPGQACGNPTGCSGAYLADLFTWLYDHPQFDITHPSNSPLRVAWYRGAEKAAAGSPDQLLVIYTSSGNGKRLGGGTPNPSNPDYLNRCRVHKSMLNELYNQLINQYCY